jgi:predicted nucleic acid-binding protein
MLGIDTNVLVRPLASNDPAQTRRARSLIEKGLADEEPVLNSNLAVLKLRKIDQARKQLNVTNSALGKGCNLMVFIHKYSTRSLKVNS